MKKIICLIACLMLNLSIVSGQQARLSPQPPPTFPMPQQAGLPPLPTFNLDFPGGSPAQLVQAIENASGKPLNVIINKEDENVQLPPLKMNDVDVVQLFTAISSASSRLISPAHGLLQFNSSYGFKTASQPTQSSIWYFYVTKPAQPAVEKTCLFFSLDPYLARGFTVDDITTAIQTGWKMAGITSPPELNYHKETKLLIACGDTHDLETIDSVLRALPSSNATRTELDSLRKEVESLRATVEIFMSRRSKGVPGTPLAPNAEPQEKSGK